MSYFETLSKEVEGVIKILAEKGIQERFLVFGGEGEKPDRKPTVPTDVRSEFLANRAMGDWAENILAHSIRKQLPELKVAHYGNAEAISAGEDGFREFYLSVLEEVRKFGKRPDLLIFPNTKETKDIPDDISMYQMDELDRLVRYAHSSIEVRSSKFEAETYIRVRKQDKESGKNNARMTPSFTVKVEDLKKVYRWIERNKVQQCYFQVFFDSVYAINVLDIFRIISSGNGFSIETPAKSQLKSTIMIPITSGVKVGLMTELPKFEAEERVTRLGRHDAFVRPIGGDIELDAHAIKEVLFADCK